MLHCHKQLFSTPLARPQCSNPGPRVPPHTGNRWRWEEEHMGCALYLAYSSRLLLTKARDSLRAPSSKNKIIPPVPPRPHPNRNAMRSLLPNSAAENSARLRTWTRFSRMWGVKRGGKPFADTRMALCHRYCAPMTGVGGPSLAI